MNLLAFSSTTLVKRIRVECPLPASRTYPRPLAGNATQDVYLWISRYSVDRWPFPGRPQALRLSLLPEKPRGSSSLERHIHRLILRPWLLCRSPTKVLMGFLMYSLKFSLLSLSLTDNGHGFIQESLRPRQGSLIPEAFTHLRGSRHTTSIAFLTPTLTAGSPKSLRRTSMQEEQWSRIGCYLARRSSDDFSDALKSS